MGASGPAESVARWSSTAVPQVPRWRSTVADHLQKCLAGLVVIGVVWLEVCVKHPLLGALLVVAAMLFLNGCAPGNERFDVDGPAGFFWGLWHGAISWVTLIVGCWNDSVHVYEVRNTGGWYDFGFILGVVCALGGGGRGGEHTWRRSRRGLEEERRNRKEREAVE